MSSNNDAQIDSAQYFAKLAVEYDKQQKYDDAKFYYMEAAQALLNCGRSNLAETANKYILRCEKIHQLVNGPQAEPKSEIQMKVERVKFLMSQAQDDDEAGEEEQAANQYMEAAESCLNLKSEVKDEKLIAQLNQLAKEAIGRAEELKNVEPAAARRSQASANPIPAAPKPVYRPLGDALKDEYNTNHSQNVVKKRVPSSGGTYSKEEIQVLRTTSQINGRSYVPFLSVDLKEKFAYPVHFSDRDGKLALSSKQKQHFGRWVRPEEYISEPKMIMAVSSFSVKQTIVSDCSFVASLAISAQYERRFHRQLITSIIYPQNRKGEPVYNPCGKYMIKLHINGVPRKVIIDDYLPMAADGQLLCSFSSNRSELWVSMLEKAYMKVMGGYDFPGSNSNIDLHALTGWIPERVAIKSTAIPFDKEKEFRKILDKFHKGDCVVTVATGAMSQSDADRAGLVESHAYAMLDIREVMGKRLLMLKNPWSHLRWRGRYSEEDLTSWTPALKSALNYDPESAKKLDNGVFWIDYESFCHFYECIYINWKPDLFPYTTCFHHTWTNVEGPKKDMYNISDNPQYHLELKNPSNSPAAVWLLLTRHITDKEDFANNREFITLFVYKGGSRVYYPYDPAPYKDGVKINSPHYLCKMVETGSQVFTLVISQYEKTNTIHYTLRVYSQCDISLNKIVDPYKHEKETSGEWKGITAGGCPNFPTTYKSNPVYQISVDNSSPTNYILVELLAPRQYSVGLEGAAVKTNAPSALGNQQDLSSGPYRKGYCILRMDSISGGIYNVIPSTYCQGEEGPFKLRVSSSVPFNISRLQ